VVDQDLPFSFPTISVAKDSTGYDEIIRWAHSDSSADVVTATAVFRSNQHELDESWTANQQSNVKALGDAVSKILYDANIRVRDTGSYDPDARVVFSDMKCFDEVDTKDKATQWTDAAAAESGEVSSEQQRVDELAKKTQEALRRGVAANSEEADTWTQVSPEEDNAPEGYEYVNVKLEISNLGANVLRDRYPAIASTGESVAIDYGISGTRAEVLDVYSTVYDATQGSCVRVGETSVALKKRELEKEEIDNEEEEEEEEHVDLPFIPQPEGEDEDDKLVEAPTGSIDDVDEKEEEEEEEMKEEEEAMEVEETTSSTGLENENDEEEEEEDVVGGGATGVDDKEEEEEEGVGGGATGVDDQEEEEDEEVKHKEEDKEDLEEELEEAIESGTEDEIADATDDLIEALGTGGEEEESEEEEDMIQEEEGCFDEIDYPCADLIHDGSEKEGCENVIIAHACRKSCNLCENEDETEEEEIEAATGGDVDEAPTGNEEETEGTDEQEQEEEAVTGGSEDDEEEEDHDDGVVVEEEIEEEAVTGGSEDEDDDGVVEEEEEETKIEEEAVTGGGEDEDDDGVVVEEETEIEEEAVTGGSEDEDDDGVIEEEETEIEEEAVTGGSEDENEDDDIVEEETEIEEEAVTGGSDDDDDVIEEETEIEEEAITGGTGGSKDEEDSADTPPEEESEEEEEEDLTLYPEEETTTPPPEIPQEIVPRNGNNCPSTSNDWCSVMQSPSRTEDSCTGDTARLLTQYGYRGGCVFREDCGSSCTCKDSCPPTSLFRFQELFEKVRDEKSQRCEVSFAVVLSDESIKPLAISTLKSSNPFVEDLFSKELSYSTSSNPLLSSEYTLRIESASDYSPSSSSFLQLEEETKCPTIVELRVLVKSESKEDLTNIYSATSGTEWIERGTSVSMFTKEEESQVEVKASSSDDTSSAISSKSGVGLFFGVGVLIMGMMLVA
jgi:hypothetical protein